MKIQLEPISRNHQSSILIVVTVAISLLVIPAIVTMSFGVQIASPPVFNSPINLSHDAASAQDPNVQNVGTHVYVVWTERSGGIKFRESPDGGLTWSPALNQPALRISNAGGTSQYPLMSTNGTNVYVAWAQSVAKTGLQIMEATSTNGGASFNSPVQLTTGSPLGGFIGPAIASWGNNVYVAYTNNTLQQTDVTCSSNAGASGSWTHPFAFGGSHEAQIAAWGGKYVYVVSDGGKATSSNNCASFARAKFTTTVGSEPWVGAYGVNAYIAGETKGNNSVVRVTSSNNNGGKWAPVANLNISFAWAPMIGAFDNSAWIAVQQHPNGSASQIFVFSTTNGGSAWNGPTSLSGKGAKGSDTSFPFTVATSDGQNVFVGWSQQIAPGYWVVRVSYSGNGGSTWTPAPGINVSQNKNGEAGNNNDVATGAISAFGTHCYVVWQYVNRTSNQIYFAGS